MMITSKIRPKVIFVIFYVLIIASTFASVYSVKADYNIAIGDSFSYEIKTLRNIVDQEMDVIIGDITLSEGLGMTLNVTYFTLPHIKYAIKVEGSPTEEFALFSEIIFMNRNWDELTEEYELTGYEVTETSKIWAVKDDRYGLLEVEYLKEDGVLSRFFADNYAPLREQLSIGELEIIRDISTVGGSGISLITMIPIVTSIMLIGALITRKKTQNK